MSPDPIPASSLAARLERSRRELLDLSARNRLISTPRGTPRARAVEVVDERSDEVFRILVREGKAMTFLAGAGEEAVESAMTLGQPEEAPAAPDAPLDPRHTDARLQTRLASEKLQARLLSLYYDAQTIEQEQGVGALFLAAGFLAWYESPSSDAPRFAPLVLIPVELERTSASSRFRLTVREEEIATNLSLQAKLRAEFGVELPEVGDEADDFTLSAYFDAVRRAIEGHPRWSVAADDMVLGFFSFAKYLMYRDLDPETWPEHAPLASHPILSRLLGDGFGPAEPPICGEGEPIDGAIPPARQVHVTDADSSQALVVEEARRGRDLVVQGPPGTGKSQTITNLIAAAVRDGKSVLFVAEKMAALEVVHGRLSRLGLGPICLELHSHKVSKKAVLEELARTLKLGRPRAEDGDGEVESLREAIERLNRHAGAMNAPIGASGVSPFHAIGILASLSARGIDATDLDLPGWEGWTAADFRRRVGLVADVEAHLAEIGPPAEHPWRGAGRTSTMLPSEIAAIKGRIAACAESLGAARQAAEALAVALGDASDTLSFASVQGSIRVGAQLVKAPQQDRSSADDPVWKDRTGLIARLVSLGEGLSSGAFSDRRAALDAFEVAHGHLQSVTAHPGRGIFRSTPLADGELTALAERASRAVARLAAVSDAGARWCRHFGIITPNEPALSDFEKSLRLATSVASAPEMDRAAIADPIWAERRAEIRRLVDRGRSASERRRSLPARALDAHSAADLARCRRVLAERGRSLFRLFSSEYRDAVATLRLLCDGSPPRQLTHRIALMDSAAEALTITEELDRDPAIAELGRRAFGDRWRGSESDWEALGRITVWDDGASRFQDAEHRRIASSWRGNAEEARAGLATFGAELESCRSQLVSLLRDVDLDTRVAFSADGPDAVPIRAGIERLASWAERPTALSDWIAYRVAIARIRASGMVDWAERLDESGATVGQARVHLAEEFDRALAASVASEPMPGAPVSPDPQAVRTLGRSAFGEAWRGLGSDWSLLGEIVAWDCEARAKGLADRCRFLLARLENRAPVRAPLVVLMERFKPTHEALKALFAAVELDATEAFGASLERTPLRDLAARLELWRDGTESLSKWIGYRIRRESLTQQGLASVIAEIDSGRAGLADRLHVAYHQALLRRAYREHPELAEFDGTTHERLIARFRELDMGRIALARAEVALAHFEGMPRGTAGEMAVVLREIEKKRRRKPIRRLLREAGSAIRAIKPVFLMSPISVAQFLDPGGLAFDLLVIDEASQVSPVDALGAMARARQVVVVGDDKQLPPSRFFSKLLDEAGAAPGDDLEAGDIESILGLCAAQGLPQRMLRWHYRSRHHSLIAVSNREFYEDRLLIVPSPSTIAEATGLHFRPVPGGVFDRGGTATNRVEARAVAEAVVLHARTQPGKSLGVAAFSVAQRDAIRDELERLQRENPDLAGFFAPSRPDPFFVKNLENIQGDERDVIFISVGYGRDPDGRFAMNFGPLSAEGGERRLNVLISRARERCEVFSSISDEDIDLQRARSRGASAFKTFLRFARTGEIDAREPTGLGHDSAFEEDVARAVRGLGFEVHPQVGTAGFRIDLAVVDPEKPGRYLLGIECDGASYHSSRSARDRDRIREAVLRDRGWSLHRVWSTDWFHRPADGLRRIAEAIERARAERATDETPAQPGGAVEEPQIERATSEAAREPAASWVVPYAEAAFDVPSGTPLVDTPTEMIAGVVTRVVEVEGPIHREEVARRVAALWGQSRVGSRIAEAVRLGIDGAIRSGALREEPGGEFLVPTSLAEVPIRSRSSVASATLRKAELLPPSEIRAAILHLAAEEVGPTCDEIAGLALRHLGLGPARGKPRELVDSSVEAMIAEGTLELREDRLFLPS